MQKDIIQTWHFKQSPEEVWEYLTKPELIEQWLMKSDFKPVVGHKFHFTYTPKSQSDYDGVTHCEVLEVKPYSKLSYSWNGNTKSSRTYNSKVTWTLVPKKNGTELQLVHNGFTALEDSLTHTSGWNTCVNKMIILINSSHANTNA